MARFFAVNWTLAVAWLVFASIGVSTWAYYHGQVYGWRDAEGVATATLSESEFAGCEHYSTTDYGNEVRVMFIRKEPGHFVDLTVKRDKQGKWAVVEFQKDFQPWQPLDIPTAETALR